MDQSVSSSLTPLPPISSPVQEDKVPNGAVAEINLYPANSSVLTNQNSSKTAAKGKHIESSKKKQSVPAVTYDLKNKPKEEVFTEVTQRINRLFLLEDYNVALDDLAYVKDASKYGATLELRTEMTNKLDDLQTVQLFQRIWKKHFDEDIFSGLSNARRTNLTNILKTVWNGSDKSQKMCETVIKSTSYIDILQYLKSPVLDPSKTGNSSRKTFVNGLMGILHNVTQSLAISQDILRRANAVEILRRFRDADDDMISCKAVIIMAYLVIEEENEQITSDEKTFNFLRKLLETTMKTADHYSRTFGWSAVEVIQALNHLAANDMNKERIVRAGVLPYYVKLLQPNCSIPEQSAAAKGLWTLAFKCREAIQQEPGCIEALENLAVSGGDEGVKRYAEGALWTQKQKDTLRQSLINNAAILEEERVDSSHVFISYQWDCKPIILKVRDELKAAGYKVWLDVDSMTGSILEAMAKAVEQAVVVVVCMTQKYKDSPNCRTEAEYSYRLKKNILPIKLQPNYRADGWLGALLGNKLEINFTPPNEFEVAMQKLELELARYCKGKSNINEATSNISASTMLTATTAPIDKVLSWTSSDVEAWLVNNDLQHLRHWFKDYTGSLLCEFISFKQEAPATFYAMLKEENFTMLDILKLNKALKRV